ncbi:MAG: 2-hydroxyacyl-CoA dehydratase [Candidatus Helarchaeota archaeon]|nr:2-hydroxyacyl-CoA dehydratase [Candidatus Helarchaeota archaeon]
MSQKKQMIELLFLKNLMKFIMKYFSGKAQLRAAKRSRRKVISVILPVGIELVTATKAMPVFLLRVGNYSSGTYLRGAQLYKNLFGWNLLHTSINLLRPILGNKFFVDIINQFIANIYGTYETYTEIAENAGAPLDACFGTRVHLGSTWPHIKYIHGALGFGTRCNWLAKTFEEVSEKVPLTLLEIPNVNSNITEEVMMESLNQVISDLEKITGQTITNENLRQQIILANQIRNSYSQILEIWSKDTIPIAPLTFSYFLAMLHIGFTDFMSEPKFFNRTLQQIIKDFQKTLKKGGYNATSMPKFLLVNAIGGYEPKLPEITDTLGGRIMIADAEIFNMLEPIETTGDILKNYARALIRFELNWMDNTSLVERYISVAEKYHLQGILFNNMYGCKSITPSLRLFKERLRDSDLALVDIGFQNIGDNLEQTKTRIGAILEIIRENAG